MKKPSIKRFKEVAERHGGNQTKIAEELGVMRCTVREWCKSDPEFDATIKNQRGMAFDEVYKSAVQLAAGIPRRNKKGEVIGWKERPDPTIAKYLMSTLGKDEGFVETTKVEEHHTTEIDVSGLTDEELATLNAILKKAQKKD